MDEVKYKKGDIVLFRYGQKIKSYSGCARNVLPTGRAILRY